MCGGCTLWHHNHVSLASAHTLGKRELLREVLDGFYLLLGNNVWRILRYMGHLKPISTKLTHYAK